MAPLPDAVKTSAFWSRHTPDLGIR